MSKEHEARETDSEESGAADGEGEEEDSPVEETEAVVEPVAASDETAGDDDQTGDDDESEGTATGSADDADDSEIATVIEESTPAETPDDAAAIESDSDSQRAIDLEKRTQRLDQREMGLDSRAEKLDAREERLDEREKGLVEQRETLAEKRTALEEREEALAKHESELDERETAIKKREQELEDYAAELEERDQTLREYVGDQVGDSVDSVISSALEEHTEQTQNGRFGPTGGLVLGLLGLAMVVGGVANALAVEAGAFSAALGSTTGNVVLSAALILVGLAGNLAAATDRV